MDVFRASRRGRSAFDPLDSSASIARDGWRFNDRSTEILYTAGVEALATLEVAARPGWHLVQELTIATIQVPDGSVVDLTTLGITLPSNWNVRPAARNAQSVGAEFLSAVDRFAAMGQEVCGVAVPSVASASDMNVLLDPRQKTKYRVRSWARIPFDWLVATPT